MARIRCRNGVEHTHSSVMESRRCWQGPGLVQSAPLPASVPITPPVIPAPAINAPVVTQPTRKSFVSNDPRLAMIKDMIQLIPEGYYATAPQGEAGHNDFIRIFAQKGKRSRWQGALTVQTQHSDMWSEPRMVFWPSGKISVYQESVIDKVMEILADYKTCAMRYSVESQRCLNCGKKLTEDRSRHYLVGPECERKGTIWPVVFADEWNGRSFEFILNSGGQQRLHHGALQAAKK